MREHAVPFTHACKRSRDGLSPARVGPGAYNKNVRAICVFALAAALHAAPAIFPLKDVHAGLHGVGRTVFSGTKIEEFQVDVLGVLENIGPRESIILAKLRGGPLAATGVMQGMSGSPVYIDGKLLGAVALAFPMSKEAIAGIRPIEEMLRVDPESAARAKAPARRSVQAGNQKLEEIATPVSFSGFTAATLDHFSKQLHDLGFDPRQGVSGGGGAPDGKLGDAKSLEPGSMISIQLVSGDWSVGADGTVTAIDGNRIYAFGHRFIAAGPAEMPFARAEVLTLVPNLSASFKISAAREWMGSITEDRNTAVSGLLGKRASMIPLEIKLGSSRYRMSMIQDPVMTPLIAQMAVFSAIDETERAIGPSTFTVKGRIDFDGGSLKLDNVYAGDVSAAAPASQGVGQPLAYALTSGFDALKLKGVSLEIESLDRRSQLQVADLAAPRQVRPGDDLEIVVSLAADNGAEISKTLHYRVPVGAPLGPLYITASDGTLNNLFDIQTAMSSPAHSAAEILETLGALRPNNKAYVRISRMDASFSAEGRDLPGPPASLQMILSRDQPGGVNVVNWRGSKVAELEIAAGERVVTGSKMVQVEVKQ
jgi:SpoIVB peptidase S55